MIHKFSDVHPTARIGDQVQIGPFTSIAADVEIGEGTWIGPNVTIMNGARIGAHCNIYPGAVISAVPQDLKFDGEHTTVEIGDRTTIRECVTINRGTKAYGKTTLGKDCLVMAYVHIAHDCIIGNRVILVNSVALAGHVEVGDWSIISGLSAVHQFVKIADHVMVGGGAMVRKDVPPFVKGAREPMSYVGINSIGLRRRGFKSEKIREIQNIYRTLFQKGLNNTQAVRLIEAEMEATTERDEILQFIKNSKRGIMKGYFSN